MHKFYRIPFATSGDRAAVPDTPDVGGAVSYPEGYGEDYQRPPSDPDAKNIERDKMNALFFDATTAIGEIQAKGVPDYITADLNGGSAYAYAINALVRYSDGFLYRSKEAANVALPTDATKWERFDNFQSRLLSATGTTNGAGAVGQGYSVNYVVDTLGWSDNHREILVGWFHAAGTDTQVVQAAINWAALQNGATLLFERDYQCATGLTLTGEAGIIFKGLTSSHAGSTRGAGLTYTGAGSGTFLAITSCESIGFQNLRISYTNASFSGKLAALPNTARVNIDFCSFNGEGVAGALYLLDLDTAIEVQTRRTAFTGAQYLVRGQNESGAGFANAISFLGCDFDRYSVAAIRNLGQGWVIAGACAFENRADDTGKAIMCDPGCATLGFEFSGGNWLGDASAAGAWSWIQLDEGTGISITGNYINGSGALTAKAIEITGEIDGLVIKANRLSSFGSAIDIGTDLIDNYDISANSVPGTATELVGTVAHGTRGTLAVNGRYRTFGQYHLETLTYSASMTPDAAVSDEFQAVVTNASAFQFENPLHPSEGQTLTLMVVNTTGGVIATPTFGSDYRIGVGFASPGPGNSRAIQVRFNGLRWKETFRGTIDIPN